MILEQSDLKIRYIVLIFFSTLLSFYFPSLGGLRIFDFFSFFILIYCINKDRLYKNNFREISSYFIFFTFFIIVSFLVTIINNANDIHFSKFLGTFFTIIYSIIFFIFFQDKPLTLLRAVNITAYIHALFFYLQFLIFKLFGSYIDLIKPITGNDSRNIAGQFTLDTSIRPSGLFGEAAAYSLFIITLMSIVLVGKRKLNLLDFIVLLSVPLSTSASGTVYFGAFLTVYFISFNKSKIALKIAQGLAVGLFIFVVIALDLLNFTYLSDKITGFNENSSYQYRIGNTDQVLSNFTDFQILFGVGYANMDITENKGSTYSLLIIEHGLLLGGLFLISIIWLLLTFKVSRTIIGLIFLLFLGTHVYSQIQFWVWILSICILSKDYWLDKNNVVYG